MAGKTGNRKPFPPAAMPQPNETAMTPVASPSHRFRRLKRSPALRAMVQENSLSLGDLIWPVFLCDGVNTRQPIGSMPGVERLSLDLVVKAAEEAAALGIPAICLFPYTNPSVKTVGCEEAWNPENLTNRAIRAIKAAVPDIAVMTDVALDPYNALGHDGLVVDGVILNDETVEALVKMALVQAEAGAEMARIIDALKKRDASAAQQASEDHVRRVAQIAADCLRGAS